MNCGTCKFWGGSRDAGLPWRQCRAIIHDNHSLTDPITPLEECDWLEDVQRQELIQIRDTAKAVCEDGSGYHAAVKCKEDFGCVLYQPGGQPE